MHVAKKYSEYFSWFPSGLVKGARP